MPRQLQQHEIDALADTFIRVRRALPGTTLEMFIDRPYKLAKRAYALIRIWQRCADKGQPIGSRMIHMN